MDDADIFDTSRVLRAALRRGLRPAAAVTGCSGFTLADAETRFGLEPGHGQVILNGVIAGAVRTPAVTTRPGTLPSPTGPTAPISWPSAGWSRRRGSTCCSGRSPPWPPVAPAADLVIAGEGAARSGLQRRAEELGLGRSGALPRPAQPGRGLVGHGRSHRCSSCRAGSSRSASWCSKPGGPGWPSWPPTGAGRPNSSATASTGCWSIRSSPPASPPLGGSAPRAGPSAGHRRMRSATGGRVRLADHRRAVSVDLRLGDRFGGSTGRRRGSIGPFSSREGVVMARSATPVPVDRRLDRRLELDLEQGAEELGTAPSVRVGIDLVEVDDVAGSVRRFGDRYLHRIFTPHELASCRTDRGASGPGDAYSAESLAGRFRGEGGGRQGAPAGRCPSGVADHRGAPVRRRVV